MPRMLDAGRRRPLLALVALAFLAGCAAAPPKPTPHTSVVLLPDEDGHVGAVIVGRPGASQRIDQAYSGVVDDGRKAPAAPTPRDRQAVESAYGGLLGAQPTKPRNFLLTFQLDSVVLTAESRLLLGDVLRVAKERRPTEITVYGHADASGSEARNDRLAADRARVVADLLHKNDPTLMDVHVQSFGDKVPLVHTEGRVPEPRNRRVEVEIL